MTKRKTFKTVFTLIFGFALLSINLRVGIINSGYLNEAEARRSQEIACKDIENGKCKQKTPSCSGVPDGQGQYCMIDCYPLYSPPWIYCDGDNQPD